MNGKKRKDNALTRTALPLQRTAKPLIAKCLSSSSPTSKTSENLEIPPEKKTKMKYQANESSLLSEFDFTSPIQNAEGLA